MNQATTEHSSTSAVQTTGHAWDGDLQEFNNPLPRWWIWSFYATTVFAMVYWVLYPAWPVGSGWTRGTSTVTYQSVDGAEETVPWNTRSQLIQDLQSSPAAQRQQSYFQRVADTGYPEIMDDPEMLAFAQSVGRGLFGDNCAACHGTGGQGVPGLFPNLADDDWLWGGAPEKIQETLLNGRNGYMPGFGGVLSDEQLGDVAAYVLSLSGEAPADETAARGETIFQGSEGACWQCHTKEGTGLQSLGSANLTDAIWSVARVPQADSVVAKISAVKDFVRKGVLGSRVMPAWRERLGPTEIKLLSVYVHQLGGGG
jgi:cytochrome c oxidase cbb3-type subunit 3